jgi:acyl-CoA synthetase (NDP forming)
MYLDLEDLFKPKSIAVIGATTKINWGWDSGNSWITGAVKQGFQGPIYPVHPKAKTILGFKAYPTILDVPDDIDLAIFTVPIKAVINVINQCVEKGVKYVHLLTAGFTETGRGEDAGVEKELVEIAQKGGIRLIGPNCMGIYCPEGGLAWTGDFPTDSGSIGFFSQSGQMAYHVVRGSEQQQLRYSKVVSFGNACDLQAHDFLNYLSRDEGTQVMGAYLEGIKDGQAFLEAARSATREKPLVIWKGGQTEGGSRATLSHTAAIAGSQKIWTGLCEQAGIISANSIEEMIYTLQALQLMPLPQSANVAILGGAGGGSVTMTDAAEKEGLKVPHLTDKTIHKLEEFIPRQGSSVKNPLDILPAISTGNKMLRVLELLRDEPGIDAMIFNMRPGRVYEMFGRKILNKHVDMVMESIKIFEKPCYVVLEKEDDLNLEALRKEVAELFNAMGVVAFPDVSLAARIMNRMKAYHDYRLSTLGVQTAEPLGVQTAEPLGVQTAEPLGVQTAEPRS